ncbi:hypothetical protein DSO57_1020835 [Entomophthora muscae]|uniref:Uncharacterized protein n=1 Tax=Entomophthora muscae TaxID=34485 RepID=A0ACC2UCJ5_9FUNG|nr:hypothetical protein DSO57_1020835 [Entomophthora muscae]
MDLYCFYKVTNELEARALEAGDAIKFEVKTKLMSAPELGFINEECTSVYEVTRSLDEFSSLVRELNLELELGDLASINSALACLNSEPFYSKVSSFFQNHSITANPHLMHLHDALPSWTDKVIRRLSMRSSAKEPAENPTATNPQRTPVPLQRSNTESSARGLLRRMTWNRSRVTQAPSTESQEKPQRKHSLLSQASQDDANRKPSFLSRLSLEGATRRPSLLKRFASSRQTSSETRPPLMRSATTKITSDAEAVEIDVILENEATFKLTVGKDITYDRLLRGIRNKAVLTGNPIPPLECLYLQYRSAGRDLGLKQRNMKNFLSLVIPHQVLVRVNENATPDARFSWLDLNVPSRPSSRRLSRNCEGLDFATPKPITTYQSFQKLESVEDYLRTPCQTEVQNIMSSSMWDTTPELQLSVCSSSSNSPSQLSPVLPSEDFSFIVNQANDPKPPQSIISRHLVPRPQMMRSLTERTSAQPKRVATLSQPLLTRQNSAPTRVDVSSLAMTRSNRIKLTVAINKEFIIKLDLPDYHQATFTSLRNRIATKFSNAGYPLRSLAKMTLTYCQFKNSSDQTTPITDTKSLMQILHKATTDSASNSIYLLLVPENLLTTDNPVLNRGGIRWDHPPNLAHVG